MTIFVETTLSSAAQMLLRQHLGGGHTLFFATELPSTSRPTALQQAEAILGNPPLAQVSDLPNLTFWQLDSAGFDKYAGLTMTIPVCNMGDYFAWPCAETIVAAVLALYRQIDRLAVWQRQRTWVGQTVRSGMRSLHGQRVIVLGAGAIGQAVRSILLGFQCDVRMLARTNPAADLHTIDELLATLPGTDLLVNTLPGSAAGYVSEQVIAAMKLGSVFANVGRGSTVDEAALIEALQRNHLGGAALDVTAQEPIPPKNPLWTLENVLLTQHTAGGTGSEDEDKVMQFVRNLMHFQRREPLENQIELARGY